MQEHNSVQVRKDSESRPAFWRTRQRPPATCKHLMAKSCSSHKFSAGNQGCLCYCLSGGFMPSPLHPMLQSLPQGPLETALRKLKYGWFGMPSCHPGPQDTHKHTHTHTHTHTHNTHTTGTHIGTHTHHAYKFADSYDSKMKHTLSILDSL